MKKTILSILLCGVMVFGLTGCDKLKNDFEIGNKSDIKISQNDVIMTIKDKTLTNKGATIVLTNNSDKNFQYGNPYELEIKKDGKEMNLGDKILQLRKKNGLSQEQLGEKVDVTRQTISNWELGETTPNPEQLKKMSKAFNVSIDEILDNDSKEFLINKISNTEKLAGIIIKILKVIGFVIVVYIIFMIIAVIGLGVFTVVKNG